MSGRWAQDSNQQVRVTRYDQDIVFGDLAYVVLDKSSTRTRE
jgi:hypothetical protein